MSKFLVEWSGVELIDMTISAFFENPIHITIELLCMFVIGYLLSRQPSKKVDPLTEEEIDQIVESWTPEPLHSNIAEEKNTRHVVISGQIGPKVTINGEKKVNFTSNDFLSLNGDKRITDKALDCIDNYGCGSCGPRGFYGTIDTHVHLEERLAKFYGTNKSIIYSADIATSTSVLPTFSKAGDVIVYDEQSTFVIQEGIKMSRSRAVSYKHLDMQDLETKLKEIDNDFKKGKKHNPKKHRRFIVVEGIYASTGNILPLQKIIQLKKKFGFRVILDESFSFGVLGSTGRGTPEHFNVPISEIDIITSSMSTAMSTMGGFCTGTDQCVDHQRLSGSGYVFSASSPPYLSVAGVEALDIIDAEPERINKLKNNSKKLNEILLTAVRGQPYTEILGNEESPLRIVSMPHSIESDALARKVCDGMLEKGVLVACVAASPGEKRLISGLRVVVNADHESQDIEKLGEVLREELKRVISSQD